MRRRITVVRRHLDPPRTVFVGRRLLPPARRCHHTGDDVEHRQTPPDCENKDAVARAQPQINPMTAPTGSSPQTSSQAALAELWGLGGGDPEALARVVLTGADPVLPSSFRIGAAAQASIAAVGLAAAEFHRQRGGRPQRVSVDMRHAAIEFRSERLRVNGTAPASFWDPLAGLYTAGDGRRMRLHTNFPHHRAAVLALLGCPPDRAAVQRHLLTWRAIEFETAAAERGAVVAAMRSRAEWDAHPQAQALASIPVLQIEKIADAPPRPLRSGPRPLSGLRVLDLTRIIAGPVAGRVLAAHGADVMLISAPQLPFVDWLVKDTGRGKLSAFVDLKTPAGRARLAELLSRADLFLQAYRPGALDALGFGPTQVAELRPGIIYGSLCAYGSVGPWAQHRGYDSLVQTATGFNQAEGEAAGVDGGKELPCQALDHATGYLLAFGAMMARARQAREGGSFLVRVSLAATGRWIWHLGRVAHGLAQKDPGLDDIQDLLQIEASAFGELRGVRHAASLSDTPAAWDRPAVGLGTHPPEWPAR
jgi:crotonobetainyl-CoA:carnitine CoA-transferase CaiB-like acyl-CoA transferase